MIYSQKKVVVLGSINIDTFLFVERRPDLGETITASASEMKYGGKVIFFFLPFRGLIKLLHVLDLELKRLFLAKSDRMTQSLMNTLDSFKTMELIPI